MLPLENEARPRQVWAAAGALTAAIRAIETKSVRRIRVSVEECGRTLTVRDRSSTQRLGRRLRTRADRGLETETPIPGGIGRRESLRLGFGSWTILALNRCA